MKNTVQQFPPGKVNLEKFASLELGFIGNLVKFPGNKTKNQQFSRQRELLNTVRKTHSGKESPDLVLKEAVFNVAKQWCMSGVMLANIIGKDPSTISRLRHSSGGIDPISREGECSIIFLKIYNNLSAILGGHMENQKQWLTSYNHVLQGKPLELMATTEGLTRTLYYLEALRGKN